MSRLLDQAAITVAGTVSRLPRTLALRIGRWFGTFIRLTARRKKPRIQHNLQKAGVRETEPAIAAAWKHVGQTLFELLWFLGRSTEEILENVEVHGLEEVRRAAAKGKGVLLVSAHTGNWEIVPMVLARSEILPVAVIARTLRTPRLEARQIACRAQAGVKTLVRGKGGASIAAYRFLARGGALGCMMDRLSGGRRIRVPCLGNATWMPLGPAELASRAGAAVLLGMSIRNEDGSLQVRFRELEVNEGASPEEFAKVIGEALDDGLHVHPEQWFWIYRRQMIWSGEYTVTDR